MSDEARSAHSAINTLSGGAVPIHRLASTAASGVGYGIGRNIGRVFTFDGAISMVKHVAVISLYLAILIFFAKAANPDFMGKSIGAVDSIVRAHIYAMFKVTTFNLNPIYIAAAIYPFWLAYLYISFFWRSGSPDHRDMQELGGGAAFKPFLALFFGALVLWVVAYAFAPMAHKYIDFKSVDQLMDTKEGRLYYGATIQTVSELARSASSKSE